MAIWTQRANRDMAELVEQEGAVNVNSVRADISRWADGIAAVMATREFRGTLRFPVVASAQNKEILTVERR